MGRLATLGGLKVPLKYVGSVLFGLVVFLVTCIFSVISLPLLIYRFIIIKLIVPMCRPDIGDIILNNGHAFATELLSDKPPRCSIVTCFVLEGTVTKEILVNLVKRRWLQQLDERGQLRYPEFKQYIEKYLGFMFWVEDKHFNLDHHIYMHKMGENGSPEASKKYMDGLVETLINDKYIPQRSPWEIHVIHNYKDPDLLGRTEEKVMTGFLFRLHHSLADGFSIFSLLVEELLYYPLTSVNFAKPPESKQEKNKSLLNYIKLPFDIIKDLGTIFLPLLQQETPWHIPDEKKKWKQIYGRSPLIPIDKIKFIKNHLGCSFSGVILSSIASSISKSFHEKGFKGKETLPVAVPVPLAGHPKRLINYSTGTICELATEHGIDSLERLKRTEECLTKAKESYMPIVYFFLQKLISFQIAPLGSLLNHNKILPSGLTNFPGPGVPLLLEGHGSKVLTCHFAAGGLAGVVGVVFTLLSLEDHIYIAATVEAGVMSRDQVDQLMTRICDEIDVLYGLAVKRKQ